MWRVETLGRFSQVASITLGFQIDYKYKPDLVQAPFICRQSVISDELLFSYIIVDINFIIMHITEVYKNSCVCQPCPSHLLVYDVSSSHSQFEEFIVIFSLIHILVHE